jgi:hypothetical protein
LAERPAKGAAKVLDVNDPYTREYAEFLEKLESGHAITMPAVVPQDICVWKQSCRTRSALILLAALTTNGH